MRKSQLCSLAFCKFVCSSMWYTCFCARVGAYESDTVAKKRNKVAIKRRTKPYAKNMWNFKLFPTLCAA